MHQAETTLIDIPQRAKAHDNQRNPMDVLLTPELVRTEYQNPVINWEFADPFIIEDHGFATQCWRPDGVWCNILHTRTNDFVNWEFQRDALPRGAPWAVPNNYWAPAVVKINNEYVMYFCGKRADNGRHAIGIATSDSLDEPFSALPEPLITSTVIPEDTQNSPGFADIDPNLSIQKKGVHLIIELLWGSGGEPIRSVRLTSDGKNLHPNQLGSTTLLHSEPGVPYKRLNEAPERLIVTNSQGESVELLLTSGHDAFGRTSNDADTDYGQSYGVMAYFFDITTNSYRDISEVSDRENNIILRDNTAAGLVNPGHHATFIDAAGDWWIAYHVIDLHDSVNQDGSVKRKMCIDRLHFDERGFPYIENGMPSRHRLAGPAVRKR